jgi:hypothetical protein
MASVLCGTPNGVRLEDTMIIKDKAVASLLGLLGSILSTYLVWSLLNERDYAVPMAICLGVGVSAYFTSFTLTQEDRMGRKMWQLVALQLGIMGLMTPFMGWEPDNTRWLVALLLSVFVGAPGVFLFLHRS